MSRSGWASFGLLLNTVLYVVIATASAASYRDSSGTGHSRCDRTSTTTGTPSRSAVTATCLASWTVGHA